MNPVSKRLVALPETKEEFMGKIRKKNPLKFNFFSDKILALVCLGN
jgi:hypothetical protein